MLSLKCSKQYSDALAKAEAKQMLKSKQCKMRDQIVLTQQWLTALVFFKSALLAVKPSTAGTQGFKRRAQQFGTTYKGLSKIQSGG